MLVRGLQSHHRHGIWTARNKSLQPNFTRLQPSIRTCATVLFPCLYRSAARDSKEQHICLPYALDSRQSLSNAKNIRLGSFYGASQIGYSLPASESILHARFSSQQLYSVLDFKAGYCFDQPLNIVGFIICCSPGSSTIPATQSSLTCCCAYKMIDSWKHKHSRSTRRW